MHLAIRDDLLLLVSGKIRQRSRIIALHLVLQEKIGKKNHVFVIKKLIKLFDGRRYK